jgi:hypothetical protein
VPSEINEATWKEAEAALGCVITEWWRDHIAHTLSFAIGFRDDKPVSRQSIKRTLTAISKLSPEAAEEALEDCDVYTRALIRESQLMNMKTGGDVILLRPACDAAEIALNRFNEHTSKGGNPVHGHQILLAEWLVTWWHNLGGAPCKVWALEGRMSPIVRFAVALFSVVERRPFDPAKAAKLIRAAMKYLQGKDSA